VTQVKPLPSTSSEALGSQRSLDKEKQRSPDKEKSQLQPSIPESAERVPCVDHTKTVDPGGAVGGSRPTSAYTRSGRDADPSTTSKLESNAREPGDEGKNVRTRRGQIYEKGINPQKGMKKLEKTESKGGLNREELKILVIGALHQFFFMGEEVFERMDLVIDSMRDEHLSSGEYLMRQGEEGSKMYVIQSGQLEITIDGNLIRMVTAGDAVGELALLFNAPRSATVRCQTDCILWSLQRETFREVQALASSHQLVQRVAWLLDVPILQRLDKLDLCKLASTLKTVPLRDGELLMTEGVPTDRCVLVESGRVQITSVSLCDVGQLTAAAKVTLPTLETSMHVTVGEKKKGKSPNHKPSGVPSSPRSAMTLGLENARTFGVDKNDLRRESLTRDAEAALGGLSMEDAPNPNEGGSVCIEYGEGCFLGIPVLMTAAGELGYWTPSASLETGRLAGVIPPATYKVIGEARISFVTLKDFEGIVGLLHDKLSHGGNQHRRGYSKDELDQTVHQPHSTLFQFSKEEFQELALLGTGSFGRVTLAKYKKSDKPEDPKMVALKQVSKVAVVEGGQLAHLHDERRLLIKVQHPFIMKLYGTFQDRDHVYFVTEAVMGGELWSVVYEGLSGHSSYGLPVEHARFYAANVIEALGFLHYKGVAYRDLKPENIMVDEQGYLRLIDLGFAKKIPFIEETKDGRFEVYPKSYTMCGTPEYLAPEFIFNKGHDCSADYWAFGVLVFELIAGHTPFVPPEGYSNITELFTAIATSKRQGIPFPDDFNHKAQGRDARDLVIKLLQAEPSHRLGNLAGRADDIKEHPFFKKHIDFSQVLGKQMVAPWIPAVHFPQCKGADESRQELLIYFGKQDLFDGF